ncbi:MAG: hypothetical protein U5Q44_12150 [Dehalococcoidia bacterium]|nr:hypothetical protein [Dehalococcoidia bacterium]
MHELAATCQELLGWELLDTLELVAGLSDASSEPARALSDLVETFAGSPAAREAIETGGPGVRERLATADPPVAEAFDGYLERFGQRATGYDPGAATLAERPELLAGLIRDRLSAGDPSDIAAEATQRRTEAEARARAAALRPSEAERQRFEEALKNARAVYGLREDNIFWTDNLPCGVIRRALVEAGRRLEQSGAIRDAADVAFLELDEIRAALTGSASGDLPAAGSSAGALSSSG